MTGIAIPPDRAARHGGDAFSQGGAKFAETFELWGGLKGDDAVLDVGCGPGRMAIGIGERFGWSNELLGFDVIARDVEVCRDAISSAHPNFTFRHVDAWNGRYNPDGAVQPHEVTFPCDDKVIDFAFATSVFTHMFRREVARYLSEAARTIKPGGRLLTSWFIMTDDAFKAARAGSARASFSHERQDGTFYEDPKSPENAVAFRYDDAVALIADAGFSEIVFHEGAWSRTYKDASKVRHSQDIFVCRK